MNLANEIKKIVKEFFPLKYWPNDMAGRGKETVSYLCSIHAIAGEDFHNMAPDLDVVGLCLNWGKLYAQEGMVQEALERRNSHSIWIKAETALELTYLELAFILLHELGHVDLNVNPEKLLAYGPQGREFYADLYAQQTIEAKYGPAVAETLALICGDPAGLGGKRSKENYNA